MLPEQTLHVLGLRRRHPRDAPLNLSAWALTPRVRHLVSPVVTALYGHR
jgi:hypothetical protein